jgi:hypothetical protein
MLTLIFDVVRIKTFVLYPYFEDVSCLKVKPVICMHFE